MLDNVDKEQFEAVSNMSRKERQNEIGKFLGFSCFLGVFMGFKGEVGVYFKRILNRWLGQIETRFFFEIFLKGSLVDLLM